MCILGSMDSNFFFKKKERENGKQVKGVKFNETF